MPPLRILNVGQCGFDNGTISRALRRDYGAETVPASTHDEALRRLRSGESFDLVLVNRVGDADGAPGVDLIRSLKADPALAGLPVMLVSNYGWAQDEAVAAGALRGFGKSDLGGPRAAEALEPAIAARG